MTDHDQAYYVALQQCAARYRDITIQHARIGQLEAFARFIDLYDRACRTRTEPIPKLCRWLGYIQGVLIERGATTVQAERDWTRPLFRPLDYLSSSCETGVHFPGREPTVGEIV